MSITLAKESSTAQGVSPAGAPGAGGAPGAAKAMSATDRPELLNFEQSEVLNFFRELIEFLREFSDARPRSRPTNPLSHKARNIALRSGARNQPDEEPIEPQIAHGEYGPARQAVQGRATVAHPGALGAPGTAGEIFRRPRSLAGSMPRPEEIPVPYLVDEGPEGCTVQASEQFAQGPQVAGTEAAGATDQEPKSRKILRVPPFVARL